MSSTPDSGEAPSLDADDKAGVRSADFEVEFEFEPTGTWGFAGTRRKFWPNLISSGLESEPENSLLYRKVCNINLAMLTTMAVALLLAVRAAVIGPPWVVLGALGVGLGAAATMVVMRKTHDPVSAGHLAAGVVYCAILGMNVARGGFVDSSSAWFVLVPLIGGLVVSVFAVWVWTTVVCLTSAVLCALPELGVEIGGRLPSDAVFFQTPANGVALLMVVGLVLTLLIEGQRKTSEEIRKLAFNDPLTGLQNRKSFGASFDEALRIADREAQCVALLFIDLDRFKEYNDTLGHAAGDQILRRVAEVLEKHVRSSDLVAKPSEGEVAVSRLGGDEFTVILSDIGSKQRTAQAAQRLLNALCRPVTIGGVELFISASIGVAVYPEDGHDAETLMRRADAGMYSAKQRGGNSFEFFAPWMNEASLRRIFVENRLRRATAREEIRVVYQPLYDAFSGRIAAAEVLARWNSPSMGEVTPGEFIPIAEETAPLIVDIGDWVMRAALAQLREWHELGLPRIRMSVNYATAQLRQLGSVEKIFRFLGEAEVDGASLELEITEHIVLGEEEPAMENLRRLSQRGIGIALDDFGTGNASINYLRRLPLSRVKIDRSFVSAVTSNPEEANLTSAIVAMAKSLGLAVTAEGVESRQQMDYLRAIGCDELQGFLLGRPVSAQEFSELLRGERERFPTPVRRVSRTS